MKVCTKSYLNITKRIRIETVVQTTLVLFAQCNWSNAMHSVNWSNALHVWLNVQIGQMHTPLTLAEQTCATWRSFFKKMGIWAYI